MYSFSKIADQICTVIEPWMDVVDDGVVSCVQQRLGDVVVNELAMTCFISNEHVEFFAIVWKALEAFTETQAAGAVLESLQP